MKVKKDIQVVILDADGTLINGNTWSSITEKLGASVQEHARIFKEFQENKLALKPAIEAFVDMWTNKGPVHKQRFKEIFTQMPLIKYAFDICKYLKNKYQVAIISGSLDLNIEVLAGRLGIERWKASSTLIFDKKGFLKTFIYPMDDAEKKSELFDEYLNEIGVKPEECAVIGDGDSDRVLFKRAGLAILIPSSMTKPYLKEKVDLVLENLEEVKNHL